MKTYHIKANTLTELGIALVATGFFKVDPEQDGAEPVAVDGRYVADWVGEITTPTGEVTIVEYGELDEEGFSIESTEPVYASVGGYHCNIYSHLPLPESLEQYLVSPTPTTPARKLAGT